MIQCLVVDDEPYARKLLEEFIERTPELQLIGSASHALDARLILQQQHVDVIFLDIQMPEITGIDFLKMMDHPPLVVFTTAYAEHALEGFELNAVDYLLKPFDFQRFLRTTNKIIDRLKESKPTRDREFMFVKDGQRLVKINYQSILYIKGSREYVIFITTHGKTMALLSMKELEAELPVGFIRIHNSFIVRLGAIEAVTREEVIVQKESLPIGATYKKDFLLQLQRHSIL